MLRAFHALRQLVEEGLVGEKYRTLASHARDSGAELVRRRKQKIFYHIHLIAKLQHPEAGLEDAHIGFAAGDNDLLLLLAPEVSSDLLVLGQIETIFFENFASLRQMCLQPGRQGPLVMNGPFERHNQRDPEIAEQTSKVCEIRLDPRTSQRLVHL